MWNRIRAAATAAATAATIVVLPLTQQGGTAQSAEIKVLSSAAPRGIFRELAPDFERTTGHQLVINYEFAADLKRRIEAGAPFDVAVLPPDMADDLTRGGKLAAGSRVDLARTGMGVAVRSGAPKPDIGTVDVFRRALLAAPTLAYANGGASGVHVNGILARLGIAEDMKQKLRPYPAGGAVEAVARGEARRNRRLCHPRGARCRACRLATAGIAELHRLYRQHRRRGKTSRCRADPFDLAHIAGCGRVVQGAGF
jgi:ABC-type molybdate transport system substrate-binding protein